MWGLEALLEGESAHDDYSLIFDKVQDTYARMANILERAGFSKAEVSDFEDSLKVSHWKHSGSDTTHAYIHISDYNSFNLITRVILKMGEELLTFTLLPSEFNSNPHGVTGQVAVDYIEDLEKLQSWLTQNLGTTV